MQGIKSPLGTLYQYLHVHVPLILLHLLAHVKYVIPVCRLDFFSIFGVDGIIFRNAFPVYTSPSVIDLGTTAETLPERPSQDQNAELILVYIHMYTYHENATALSK